VPISLQARALLGVTVSDRMRLLSQAPKKLIVTIVFFVAFGAQSGCSAEPYLEVTEPATDLVNIGVLTVEGVRVIGVPADRGCQILSALVFSITQNSNL
jgi:hypothetical protein